MHTRTDHPVAWARAQNNLAFALTIQANRTGGAAGAALLAEAIAAFSAALEVHTRADHPVDWAKTQGNLANAERDLALRPTTRQPAKHLASALAHVDAALTVYDAIHMAYNFGTATRLRSDILGLLAAAP